VTGPAPAWGVLQAAIAGEVILPDSPDYESARQPAIASFNDVRPQAVVRCAGPGDVVEALSVANRAGLRTVARSGGHCFAGHSSSEGIVIDVAPMRSVSVSDGVATVGAGARLGEVYDSLQEHGLTIAAGCGPEVGIAGLTLGGGLGILGRKHGLTSDQLLAVEVVLADGRIVESDDRRDEELFWALRGAGAGTFGVVTSFVFSTLTAPSATAFHLAWPHAAAVPVIEAWQDWAPAAPDELAASLLLTAASAAEQPPRVNVFGAMLGSDSETAELLDQFIARAGTDPTSATQRQMPFRETKRYLVELGDTMGEDPAQQTTRDQASQEGHPFSKSEFFQRPLPSEAIAAVVESLAKDRVPGQRRELDFTPWGGAYNRVRADATAFAHRDELFLLKHAVVVDPGASIAESKAARRWLARSWASVRPWGSGRAYQNFPDPELAGWGRAYYGSNYERLLRVKARYDPGNFFRFPQSLPSPSRRPSR
jgi:FAD/FMN-containing dehydrogenase